MKRNNLLILILALITSFFYAQTNTFPDNDNVGIGTLTPNAKLHVNGGIIKITNAGQAILELDGSSTESSYDGSVIRMKSPDVSIGNHFQTQIFQTETPDGIGSFFIQKRGLNNEYYGNLIAYTDSDGWAFSTSTDETSTTTQSHLFIKNSGNIGIGTGNPNAKLNIHESNSLGASQGDSQILTINSISTISNHVMRNEWFVRDANGSDWLTARHHNGLSVDNSFMSPGINTKTWWERDPHSGSQYWGNTSDIQMALTNGNLGIGTDLSNNPNNYKLAVKGTIGAQEVKVENSSLTWSDFVFYENYNLPTLKQVEQHIKEKGHLKDIPSAIEVAKNGILLGEMDAKLLQKIEELTLYAIEQDKQTLSLKKELVKQQNINKDLEARLLKLEALLNQ
ncbi:hypothetical protein [Neotamlana laminarinivorans]|uniref:Uncharacterized protein n=1 Tax=Neotamlana laminarinivorans TaxID=2883124 RepID=A0A9X1L3G5_9FLAO|nr:hypothetical protein [Tamlana laminarinivorans]MCB4797216.1 hypothetical protein [Tamlana laminarinivorans]